MRTHRATHRRRLSTALLGAGLTAFLVVGCSGAGVTPTSTPTFSASIENPTPEVTVGPTDPSNAPGATPPSQTDTAWGRIWDGLPAGFPAYPGTQPTETGGGAASATLDAGSADPGTVITFYRSALESAGYSTVALTGPMEDGSRELASAGEGACQIRTTVAPLGTSSIVTILYGAGCPFN